MKMAKIRVIGSFLICFALLLALGYGIVGIYSYFFHTIDDGFYSNRPARWIRPTQTWLWIC